MIKKLSKKLVLVFSLLTVFIFTVSSCYAYNSDRVNDIGSLEDAGIPEISKTNINTRYMYNGNTIGAASANYPTNAISWFDSKDTKAFYFKMHGYTFCIFGYEYTNSTYSFVANSGVGLIHTSTSYYNGFSKINFSSYLFVYNNSLGWCYTPGISDTGINYSSSSSTICDFMSFYDNKLDIYCPNTTVDYFSVNTTTKTLDEVYFDASEYVSEHVDVSHEFQSDTSAIVTFDYSSYGTDYVLKYSLAGIEVSTDLTAPVTLKNPVIYHPGVTNLQVKENTKIYWVLYDSFGDSIETDVYTVPEYTSSNVDKELKYNINYNEDFTVAYLNVSVVNGEFSDKLYYSEYGLFSNNYEPKMLFPASGTLEINHNCNLHIILYDYFGNIICADYVTIDKIGTIPADNFKVNVSTSDKTVILYPRLYNILQSDFYDIEYDVSVDSWTSDKNIILYQDGVYIGNIFDINSSRTCLSNSELRFYQNIGTSNITITFRIINIKTGATCITRTISFKIGLDSESTGVTGSTTDGSDDNSFIIGTGSFSENFSGFLSLNENSSIKDIISTAKGSLENISIIFSILPGWLWLFVSVGLGVCILLRILSR